MNVLEPKLPNNLTCPKLRRIAASMLDFINSHDLFYPTILVVLVGSFNMLLIRNFFPITEGWFQDWSRYIGEGQIPYRDFYLYIPPVFVYIAHIINTVTGGLYIALRVYGVIERILLVLICYRILRRFFSDQICFLSLIGSSGIYMSLNSDVFYGYYQNSLFWGACALLFLLRAWEFMSSGESRRSARDVCAAGILCGLSIMSKQTALLFVGVTAIVFICLIAREYGCISASTAFLWGLIGICAAVLPILISLYCVGALESFIAQVFFGSSSKGSLSSVLVSFIPRMFDARVVPIFLSLAVFYIANYLRNRVSKESNALRICGYSMQIAFLAFVGIFFYWSLKAVLYRDISMSPAMGDVASVLIVLFLIFLTLLISKHSKRVVNFSYIVSVVFAALILYCFFFITTNQYSLASWSYLRERRQILIYAIFFFLLAKFLVTLIGVLVYGVGNRAGYSIALAFSVSFMYTHGLSYIIEDHAMLLPFALLFGEMCQKLSAIQVSDISSKCLNYLSAISAVALPMILIVSAFYQRVWWPYNWWGVNSMSARYYSTYQYDDPHLEGLLGSEDETRAVNQIISDLLDAGAADNELTLYTFPHINYFNTIFGNDSPTFAKVHYFDVCPDDIAEEDAATLLSTKPDFILWMDFDDQTWATHEAIFRQGNESGQRQLDEAVNALIESGEYTLLGEYNFGNHSSPIYLYQRK